MDSLALYIHIPFCRQKCCYCSFLSYAGRETQIEAYIAALKKELTQRLNGQTIYSIYFGGGTPSLLSPTQIGVIINTVNALSDIADNAEITVEANPGTVDKKYLVAIRDSGINRLSLGAQSFSDDELAILGRIHSVEEAREAFRFARQGEFTNLNLDIIYGIPNQTIQSWRKTLSDVINLNPEHISLYPLTLEEDTPMWLAIKRGDIPPLDPDLAADQYELAEEMLGTKGYNHYEISNWAKGGYECRHNLVYWHCQPYIGIGIAAHSYINGHRLSNTSDLDKYLFTFSHNNEKTKTICEMDEKIDPDLQLSEAVILGLRLSEGIALEDIKNRFDVNLTERFHEQIEEMSSLGLLEFSKGNIRLTRRGRLLGNEVFQRFLPV